MKTKQSVVIFAKTKKSPQQTTRQYVNQLENGYNATQARINTGDISAACFSKSMSTSSLCQALLLAQNRWPALIGPEHGQAGLKISTNQIMRTSMMDSKLWPIQWTHVVNQLSKEEDMS